MQRGVTAVQGIVGKNSAKFYSMIRDKLPAMERSDKPVCEKIRHLDDHVINQIAAGEVVERPLSIVKELVENSLDAGATDIDIRISRGGIDAVSVRDNGRGIPSNELMLALQRHCTSKLISAHDLSRIASLGFRGEALASIGAVSELTLVSRHAGAAQAWHIDCSYGQLSEARIAASYAVGTLIKVERLFAKTPARRKFLKQPRTEFLQIQQFLKHVAFCYPEVAIAFTADDKQVFKVAVPTNQDAELRRLHTLFGKEFVASAVRVEYAQSGLSLRGWLGHPEYHRPRADLQYLSINRRVVKDRTLFHAVRIVFDGKIPEGRYPSFALDIGLAADDVDVNVHPMKSEVRFSEPRRIHDHLYSALNHALGDGDGLSADAAVCHDEGSIVEKTYPQGSNQQMRIAESKPSARRGGNSAWSLFQNEQKLVDSATLFLSRYVIIDDEEQPQIFDLREMLTQIYTLRLQADQRSRPLILPERVDSNIYAQLDDCRAALHEFGIVIEELGVAHLVLREVPLVFFPMAHELFLSELASSKLSDRQRLPLMIARAAANAALAPREMIARRRWLSQALELGRTCDVSWREFAVLKTREQWLAFLAT